MVLPSGFRRHAQAIWQTDGRRLIAFSSAALLSQLATMAGSLMTMRWLGPDELGIWQAMLLLDTYLMVLRLGVINGLNRQLPLLLGQEKLAGAYELAATATRYTLCLALALLVGLETAALCTLDSKLELALGFAALGVQTSCGLYAACIEATFRGERSFGLLRNALLLQAAASIASLPLVVVFGYEGHCLRVSLISCLYALLLHAWRPIRISARFSFPALWVLLRVGLPLFIQNYFGKISLSAGAAILLWVGGRTAIGHYAPVAAILSLAALLPNSIMTYVMPTQTYDFGKHGSVSRAVAEARGRAFLLMAISAPIALVALPLVPYLTDVLIPKYSDSAGAMQLALVVGVVRVFSVATSVYATVGAWKQMLINQGVLGLSQIVGAFVGVVLCPSKPWFGAAGGLLAAYVLYIPVTLLSLNSLAGRKTVP